MKYIIVALSFLLSACSIKPSMELDTQPVLVEVTQGLFIALPQPSELKENINVSQLITAQWGESNKQKLLVQLQVDQQKVILAGFSAWGVKLLSLSYFGEQFGHKIETNVIAGLADKLPQPEQVLFNVMLAIWPEDSWHEPLESIGWRLQQTPLQRILIDDKGDVIITIDYQRKPYLNGLITYQDHRLDYRVDIETKL